MLLSDKVCIISGIGPGLGQELARAAAREGAAVVLAARTESYLREVEAELKAAGARALAVPTDITQRDRCQQLVESTLAEFGRIDALVNSAYAPGKEQRFEDSDLADWHVPMNVNLFGSLELTQHVVPAMKAQGGGAIVFVNSMIQKKPLPGQGAYATSKGALTAAAKVLAKELGPYRIRVNSVYLGWMWGPAVQEYLQAGAKQQGLDPQNLIDGIVRDIPLGSMPDDADCANAVLFLVSDYARVVTGASLDVNGGEWMP